MPIVKNTANVQKVFCHGDGSRLILDNNETAKISKERYDKFEHYFLRDKDLEIGIEKKFHGKAVKAPEPTPEPEPAPEPEIPIAEDKRLTDDKPTPDPEPAPDPEIPITEETAPEPEIVADVEPEPAPEPEIPIAEDKRLTDDKPTPDPEPAPKKSVSKPRATKKDKKKDKKNK
jgi:hypothetical protein